MIDFKLDKKKGFISSFLGFIALVFLGSSGGVGTFQREDRTGSPLSLNSTCGTCHYGGNFQSKLELTVWKDSTQVKTYLPNTNYLIKVTISSVNQAKIHGVQLVAFQGETSQQAGTFFDVPNNLRAVQLWNRTYIEQSRPQKSNEFVLPWKSPEKEVGKISFYAAGLAANENNDTSGDSPVKLEDPFLLQPASITRLSNEKSFENKTISFTPFDQDLKVVIKNFERGIYKVSVFDMMGREAFQKKMEIFSGQELLNLPVLNRGYYVISIDNGKGIFSKSFFYP